MPRTVSTVFAVLIIFLCLPTGFAQEPSASPGSESTWGLGAGVGTIQQPYKDVGGETIALPILLFENRWVSIAGPVADLKLPSAGSVAFRLRARYEPGAGYEAGDSPALSGTEKRKAGVWIGGAVLWHTQVVDIGAEWLADVTGYSEGQRAALSLQRRFAFGDVSITPRIEAIWIDRKNADYYYGVRAQDATPDRPFYEAQGTVNARVGMRVDYRLWDRHSVFLDLSATRLGNEVKNSPIVDRSGATAVFVGYTYQL